MLEGRERPWFPRGRLFCCRKDSFVTSSWASRSQTCLISHLRFLFPHSRHLLGCAELTFPNVLDSPANDFQVSQEPQFFLAPLVQLCICSENFHSPTQWVPPKVLFFPHKRTSWYQTTNKHRFSAICYIVCQATLLPQGHQVHSQTSVISHRRFSPFASVPERFDFSLKLYRLAEHNFGTKP